MEHTVPGNPRIINQNVHRPQLLFYFFHYAVYRSLVCHIASKTDGAHSLFVDLFCRFLNLLIADIEQRYLRALVIKPFGNCPANPLGCSGHCRCFSFKPHIHFLLSSNQLLHCIVKGRIAAHISREYHIRHVRKQALLTGFPDWNPRKYLTGHHGLFYP